MRMAMVTTLMAIVLAGSVSAQEKESFDWPHWRGPDYNGISQEEAINLSWPEDGPAQLWEAQVGTGFTAVSVQDGRMYTMGNIDNRDIVSCFDALTGEKLWERSYDCPLEPRNYEGGPNASVTIYNGLVYTFSRNADLFCFDAVTGEERWNVPLMHQQGLDKPKWGFAGSPLIQGDVVIVNAGPGGIGLNRYNGKVVWESGTENPGYATPVPFNYFGRRAVAIFAGENLVATTPDKGIELFRYNWPTRYQVNAADPIIQGNEIFISSGYGTGCALIEFTEATVKEIWRNRNMRNHFNSCVMLEGYLYGFDENQLRCLSWQTGDVTWTERGLGKGSLMAIQSHLIVLSETGDLVIAPVDSTKFERAAQAKVLSGRCWTMPVLANGILYVRNADGYLRALDLRVKESTTTAAETTETPAQEETPKAAPPQRPTRPDNDKGETPGRIRIRNQ